MIHSLSHGSELLVLLRENQNNGEEERRKMDEVQKGEELVTLKTLDEKTQNCLEFQNEGSSVTLLWYRTFCAVSMTFLLICFINPATRSLVESVTL